MAEDTSEHVEARLNAFIERQEQTTQSLKDELADMRLALERQADTAKETEKHLNNRIHKHTRFVGWMGALLIALFAVLAFIGYGNFNAAVTQALAPEKIETLLSRGIEDGLAEARAEIQREVTAAKSAVAQIRETADEAEHEHQKITAQAAELAQLHSQRDVSAYITQGSRHWLRKEYDEALAAFDKALALDPGNVHAWNNKGSTLNSLKRYDEALAALDKAVELDPDYTAAWDTKGSALNGLERSDEALAAYDKALALNPDYAAAWRNKGDTYSRLGDRDQALDHLRKAVELDPTMASVAVERGLYEALWEDEVFKQLVGGAQKAAGE